MTCCLGLLLQQLQKHEHFHVFPSFITIYENGYLLFVVDSNPKSNASSTDFSILSKSDLERSDRHLPYHLGLHFL